MWLALIEDTGGQQMLSHILQSIDPFEVFHMHVDKQ